MLRLDRKIPNIAIVYQLRELGGVQTSCLTLIRGLNQLGIVPTLLWDREPDWNLLRLWGVQAGFQPLRLPVPSRLLDLLPFAGAYLLGIANTIDGYQYSGEYDFFYIFYNGFLIPKRCPHVRYLTGPPLLPQLDVASPGLRGVPFRSFRWIYRKILWRYKPAYEYHLGSEYVTISRFTARLFQEAHGVMLPVIHPPIDVSQCSFEPGDLTRRDTITFFSRFVAYKRPEMVLALARRYPQLRCVLMGGLPASDRSYFERLKGLAREWEVDQAIFIANPSDERVQEELSRTKFFVFPAINEHFGMVTPEAIASGAIPFVHDSGGQVEIVPDGSLRFSDEQFLDKFDFLVRLPDSEFNAIRMALRNHIDRFSADVFLKKMLAYVRRNIGVPVGAMVAEAGKTSPS